MDLKEHETGRNNPGSDIQEVCLAFLCIVFVKMNSWTLLEALTKKIYLHVNMVLLQLFVRVTFYKVDYSLLFYLMK